MNKIENLIDFSKCNNVIEISSQFEELAEVLINEVEFNIHDTPFRITDIELALNIPGVIEDEFHFSYLQKSPFRFYVHKKNGKSYKAGRIIGIDITAGGMKDDEHFFGTILIKGIEAKGNEPLIGKAGTVLNQIIRGFNQKKPIFSKWTDEELRLIEAIDNSRVDNSPLNFHYGLKNFKKEHIYFNLRNSFNKNKEEFNYTEDHLELRASTASLAKEPKIYPHGSTGGQQINVIPDITDYAPIDNTAPYGEVIKIESESILSDYLEKHDLKIGGEKFNSKTIVPLKDVKDLRFVDPKIQGCYFIFADIPEKELPTFSPDGYECNKHIVEYEGIQYRCIYNGKAQNVNGRLKQHLFNQQTLLKIHDENYNNNSISGTGAISLEAISYDEAIELEKAGKHNPSKQKLKPVKKAIKEFSHVQFEGKDLLLNGIDITEPQWKKYNFAVFVVETDNELGKTLIEEAFAVANGRPPLCRRHG